MSDRATQDAREHSPYVGEHLRFHLALARHAEDEADDPGADPFIRQDSIISAADEAEINADRAATLLNEMVSDGVLYHLDSDLEEHRILGLPGPLFGFNLAARRWGL